MSAFKQLEQKLAGRKGVTNPAGLAAYIGREKAAKAGQPNAMNVAAANRESLQTVLRKRRGK